jgi:predicted kinase
VFANAHDRDAIQHIAAAAGVPFTGVWLEAPEAALIHRVAARPADVSDADAEVIRRQRTYRLGLLRWHHLDASGTRQQVCDGAAEILHPVLAACDPPAQEKRP